MKKLGQIIIIILLICSCNVTVTKRGETPITVASSPIPVVVQNSQNPVLPSAAPSAVPAISPSIIPSAGIAPSIIPLSITDVSNLPVIDELTPTSGFPNDYCTIKGKNFGEKIGRIIFSAKTAAVSADEIKISFWNNEKIVFVLPELNTFTYDVIVETFDAFKSNSKEFILIGVSRSSGGGSGGGGGGGGGVPTPPTSTPTSTPTPTPSGGEILPFVITSLEPNGVFPGSPDLPLIINGKNFTSYSIVNFNGKDLTTTYVSPTYLKVTILASEIVISKVINLIIKDSNNILPESSPITFNVSNPNPVPTLTSISPTEKLIKSDDFTLTVNGINFVDSSYITFNGEYMLTTHISGSQLSCTVPKSKLDTGKIVDIRVVNPLPAGGTTAPQYFTVKYPTPTISYLLPGYIVEAGNAVNIKIIGTNFFSGSAVTFGGTSYPAYYIDPTQLQINVPATATTPSGSQKPVIVTNPSPGGGTANTIFYIGNPAPTITGFNPRFIPKNGGGTVKILGYNFLSNATAKFNENSKTVTYISSTELRISLTSEDTTIVGRYPIEVTNPGPGGGNSTKNFTIMGTITTISLGSHYTHDSAVFYAPTNKLLIGRTRRSRGDGKVSIINLDNNSVDTTIGINWLMDIKVHNGKKIAIVTSRNEGCVRVIDLDPTHGTYNQIIANICGLSSPKNINIDEETNTAYVTTQRCQNFIYKIDLDAYSISATYNNVGSCLIYSGYNPLDLRILAVDVDNNKFYSFDSLGGTTTINMNTPKVLRMDIANQRAFITGRHDGGRYVKIVDLKTYKVIKTYAGSSYGFNYNLGKSALDYDAVNNRVVVGSRRREGTNITVINLNDNSYYSVPSSICGLRSLAFISNNCLAAIAGHNRECGELTAEIIQLPE